jgi:predicted nuclease with TOPRIM domain
LVLAGIEVYLMRIKKPNIKKERSKLMDVKTYCDGAMVELVGWKAKVYDVVRKMDKMSSGDKEKVVPLVRDLHIIIEEMGDRLGKLSRECPTQWAPERSELEGKMTHLKKKWEEVWENVSPAEVGG